MATDSIIVDPRIDRRFCNPDGSLTISGYALLWKLIKRTGGVVNIEFDPSEIMLELDALALQPAPQPELASLDDPLTPAPCATAASTESPDARLFALEAQVAKLATQINDLQQGYQI